LTSPAWAGLPQSQLDQVRVDAKAGAAFPLALRFVDLHGTTRSLAEVINGKPAVVVFADYTCSDLCGPILAFAAAGLAQSGLRPGRDFHLIVIGLDPKDSAAEASAMKTSRIGTNNAIAQASVFLIGNKAGIAAATEAAGYHYFYDKETDQFAHPAAAFVVARDGRIVRVLSGLGLMGDSLRLALVDAGEGRVGTLLDQIRLCCFGFDPARGIYTASITRILTVACCVTAAVLFGGIASMTLAWRRRAAS
jgi:protein SCO1/2